MIPKELFTKIKLLGVESGVIEIHYGSVEFLPCVAIGFYDEDTDVDYMLESIILGEYSSIKESYTIGEFDLNRIKNSGEAKEAEKKLFEHVKKIETKLKAKAKEFAVEISKRAEINVKVDPRLHIQSLIGICGMLDTFLKALIMTISTYIHKYSCRPKYLS